MTKSKLAVAALALAALALAVVALLPTKVEAKAITAVEIPLFAEPMASLPSCGAYDGSACTIGTRFRCLNAPNEPGICRCPAGIYVCG